jgi:RNA polymerase sigma-70 factor (ECF subfamily)
MLQASSIHIRPATGINQQVVSVRRARQERLRSRATGRVSEASQAVAPRDTSNEWSLVQLAIAGDVDAQERLFIRQTSRLNRIAFAVLRNKEDAEDATQEGLCKAFISLSSFQGRSSFSTWLTRIIINAALMIRRKNMVHPEASLDEILDSQPADLLRRAIDRRPDPETLCATGEIDALVERHVGELAPDLQTAYRLVAIKGLSAVESSRALGIPKHAFKSQVFRARRKLARGLHRSLGAGALTQA